MLNRGKHDIYNIVCSLTSIMLKKDATKIDLNIDNNEEYMRIRIVANIKDLKKASIDKLREFLEKDEDYDIPLLLYEGLYDDIEEENIYLIASLIDKSYVNYDGENIEIILVKEKNGLTEVE